MTGAHVTIGNLIGPWERGGGCWGASPPWLKCGEAGAIELFMSDLDFWVGHLGCRTAKTRPGKCTWCYVLMSSIDNSGPVAAWDRGGRRAAGGQGSPSATSYRPSKSAGGHG